MVLPFTGIVSPLADIWSQFFKMRFKTEKIDIAIFFVAILLVFCIIYPMIGVWGKHKELEKLGLNDFKTKYGSENINKYCNNSFRFRKTYFNLIEKERFEFDVLKCDIIIIPINESENNLMNIGSIYDIIKMNDIVPDQVINILENGNFIVLAYKKEL